MQQTPQPQTKEIPLELIPYIEAIVDLSKHNAWITTIYNKKIIPFIDKLIRVDTFANRNITLHELLILKAYFTKSKLSIPKAQREYFIHLRNEIKICDALTREIEFSFFAQVAQRRPGFTIDSFLPDTFRRHLRSILEIQILLFIESEVQRLKGQSIESKRMELYLWVRKELNLKKGICNVEKQSVTSDYSQVKPNQIYYFFNGAQHLFILWQLEWIQFKSVSKDWQKWKHVLMKERFSMSDLISVLTVPTAKFIFYLFCLSLLPYRILRTVVNQLSNYCTSKLQEIILKHFPYNSKRKAWTSMNIIFQLSLYIALIVGVGLPLFPLPMVLLPEFLFTKWLLLFPLVYSASIVVAGSLARILDKKPIDELQTSFSMENKQQTVETMVPRQVFIKTQTCEQSLRIPLKIQEGEAKNTISRIHLK